MTLGERIKKARKALDLTQQEFADRIGMKRNSIGLIEIGRNNVSNPAIFSICREFNINEEWLRTGAGEMFVKQSKEEEISGMVHGLLSGESAAFKQRFIAVLSKLDDKEWAALEKYMKEIIGAREASENRTLEDTAKAKRIASIEAEIAELEAEKKALMSSASAHGNAAASGNEAAL